MKRDASEKHYVVASRVATFITLILSLVVTIFMQQISHAWEFLLMLGAGTGLVYILRWYWWRVNAWSEVSAMAAAVVVSLVMRFAVDQSTPQGFAQTLIITTLATTIIWLIVTLATKPEPRATLDAFYRKVRPAGSGWGAIARESGIEMPRGEMTRNTISWIAGVVMVYSIMFATGSLIFGYTQRLMIFGTTLAISAVVLWLTMRGEQTRRA
jgi:hypothetical protein